MGFVHSPSETASNYTRWARETAEVPGVQFGGQMGTKLIPLRKGRVLGLLARPGHMKTTLGGYWVREEAEKIVARNETDKFYTAHICWEQPVEELEAMYQMPSGYGVTDVAWGRVPMATVIKDSLARPSLPVWLFGDSIYSTDFDSPPMTVEVILEAIHGLYKERGMLPRLLFFDYIQDIPVPDEHNRLSQVTAAMRAVKRLAVQAKCPVIVGIQANQRVDDYAIPIPAIRDAEWSSVIGQKTDALISMWKPARTTQGEEMPTIDIAGSSYMNNDNLLVIRLLKQRFEKGLGTFALDFDPNTMILRDATPAVVRNVDLTRY